MAICQICKQREATVYFTQIINGKKTDAFVCSQCAGASDQYKIDLNSLITGLLNLCKESEETDLDPVVACSNCGMTVDTFNNTGKMGCSKCYEAFFEPMQALLKRIQGNTKHHGKIPEKYLQKHAAEAELEQLRAELKECIRLEEYEQAAVLRDRIRQLDCERSGS